MFARHADLSQSQSCAPRQFYFAFWGGGKGWCGRFFNSRDRLRRKRWLVVQMFAFLRKGEFFSERPLIIFFFAFLRLTDNLVALKEIRLEHEEGAPCTAIREGTWGLFLPFPIWYQYTHSPLYSLDISYGTKEDLLVNQETLLSWWSFSLLS